MKTADQIRDCKRIANSGVDGHHIPPPPASVCPRENTLASLARMLLGCPEWLPWFISNPGGDAALARLRGRGEYDGHHPVE